MEVGGVDVAADSELGLVSLQVAEGPLDRLLGRAGYAAGRLELPVPAEMPTSIRYKPHGGVRVTAAA